MILYDANNVYHRRLMTELSGQPIRTLMSEIHNAEGHPVVVWDGKRSLDARRQLYPGYKQQRETKGEDLYAGMRLLQEALRFTRCIQVEIEGYEADDVIASIVRDDPCQVEHIVTNDGDLGALGIATDKDPPVEPRWVHLYKCTVGDPSDNIPGIKGFGKKAWENLSQHDGEILEAVAQGQNVSALIDTNLRYQNVEWVNQNLDLFRTFWKITDFFQIEQQTILDHMVVGNPNLNEADRIIREYEV